MSPKEDSSPSISFASDHSLLVVFGNGVSRDIHHNVQRLFKLLQSRPPAGLRNIHPAYNSVLVSFDPLVVPPKEFELHVTSLLDLLNSVLLTSPRLVQIPVCYDRSLAPDLEFVASHTGLAVDDVIQLHASVEYLVYFIGFTPGFPYLGELPDRLATPRLAAPRLCVPEGSVAIGGRQTGIYSLPSPGGWRVIGRTPLKLFRPRESFPTLLEIGDQVRFRPVSLQEFNDMMKKAK
ncbi:MAG: 5-oxoprolinase subunit PxpB [Ignavibacteriales bacterium]|nr:5-oxoprolinase subunit PxpB [Ignavibacteriales bacterium]